MGVDRTSYLIYGFKFTDEKEMKVLDDNYDELMEDDPYSGMFNNSDSDQTIVYDGMCGQYVYIGMKLAEIREDDFDNISVEISETEVMGLDKQLSDNMEEWPEYVQKLCRNKEPKLYFFVHVW